MQLICKRSLIILWKKSLNLRITSSNSPFLIKTNAHLCSEIYFSSEWDKDLVKAGFWYLKINKNKENSFNKKGYKAGILLRSRERQQAIGWDEVETGKVKDDCIKISSNKNKA